MKNIGAQFDINLSGYKQGRFLKRINFAISGNKSRWSGRDVFLDERWKKEIAAYPDVLAEAMVRENLRFFGSLRGLSKNI